MKVYVVVDVFDMDVVVDVGTVPVVDVCDDVVLLLVELVMVDVMISLMVV